MFRWNIIPDLTLMLLEGGNSFVEIYKNKQIKTRTNKNIRLKLKVSVNSQTCVGAKDQSMSNLPLDSS